MKSIVIKSLFVSLLLSLSSSQIKAQKADIERFRNIIEPPAKRVYTEAKGNKNEVVAVFSGLFLGYKNFVSSQDQNVCSFTPSCSEFGILAVKRFGVVKGGVLTMDRLTRCNGLSPEKYQIDKQRRLLIDKPEGNQPIGVNFR
jgi:uncharacterized protein